VLGASALFAAACGGGDEGQSMTTIASDFTGCMVTDLGGVDDRSFNETSWNGLVRAEEDGLSGAAELKESDSPEDFEPNLQELVQMDCDLIVTVGFLLGDATEAAAEENPDERFAIVDYQYGDENGPYEIDNVKPMVFNTHEAAFLAGYLAAAQSETGKVGTWGGLPIPTVTIFMDGFVDGVEKYNEDKDASVEVLGWDKDAQEGEFVGDFENEDRARQITDDMLAEGVDVFLPVAGALAAQAAEAAQEAGEVSVIWVDADGVEAAPDYADVILTSVMKGLDVAVVDTVGETVGANYTNIPYIGTLANGGVGLAPFHEFDDEISDETKQELADLQRQIIIGELEVESPSGHN
jgi:basic membrane protein A